MPEGCEILDPNLPLTLSDRSHNLQTKKQAQRERPKVPIDAAYEGQYDGKDMNLGMPEMIFIFLMALVVFGPRKLPELGRQLGKALNEFKKASNEFKYQLESEIKQLDNGSDLAATARDLHQTFSRPVGETVFNTLMSAASVDEARKHTILPPVAAEVGTYPGSPGSPEAGESLATDPAAVQAAQAVAAEIEAARSKVRQREDASEQASLFNAPTRESNG